MSISDGIVEQFRHISDINKTPTKITMGQGVFDELKHELESITNIKVSDGTNHFMGVKIEVEEGITGIYIFSS